jgi:hypothetical protein
MRFEIFTAVKMLVTVFWDETPRSLLGFYQLSSETLVGGYHSQ